MRFLLVSIALFVGFFSVLGIVKTIDVIGITVDTVRTSHQERDRLEKKRLRLEIKVLSKQLGEKK